MTAMQRFALTLASLLALAAPAAAQQQMTWQSHDSAEGGALVLGVPETDDVAIFFLCTRGSDDVVVQPMIGSKGLAKDAPARAILTSGKVRKSFTGKAVANEESGAVNVEAGGKMADVLALLKGGKTLTIETKGASRKVSLTGAAAAAESFAAACKAP